MAFKKIQFQDQSISLFQDNVEQAFAPLQSTLLIEKTTQSGQTVFLRSFNSQPFVGGNLIKQPITSGVDNLIAHGLGRLPKVWTVMRLDANTNIWEVSTTSLSTASLTSSSTSDEFINLWCGTSCNVTIWVN